MYYLTTLDVYAIVSLMILVVLCIWHSVIAAVIFHNDSTPITPDNTFVQIDRWVMIGMLVSYFSIHGLMLIWLFFVPYKRRREMEYLDRQYTAKKHIRLDTSRSRFGSTQELRVGRSPFIVDDLPQVKVERDVRSKENTIILPDPTLLLPVQDDESVASEKLEVHEPEDDASADHGSDERTVTPIDSYQEDV